MTDLEATILDILRQARRAMTNSDIQTQLIGIGFTLTSASLHRITDALIVLEGEKKVRNELAWRALEELKL